ncbi:MAG: hypothetical protein JW797_15250 [Bradymonadales bacterium]|nr:hypothetical protein [Bradymonadales bacterium]
MILSPSSPLAVALNRQRDRYNARFLAARRLHRHLEPQPFLEHLASYIEPAVRAVAELDLEAVDRVTEALYDLSIELFAKRVLGQRPMALLVGRVFRELLPAVPELLARRPRTLTATLCNAAYNLSSQPTVDGGAWIEAMIGLAPACEDPSLFLEAGKVLAWKAGLAHYRESALAAWNSLPDRLKRATLGLSEDGSGMPLDQVAQRLSDPWWRPEGTQGAGRKKLAIVGQVGGFRGFGGPFTSPPEVVLVGDRIFAFDNALCWSLHADCFGATLQRFGADLPEGTMRERGELAAAHGAVGLDESGLLAWDDQTAHLPLLAHATGWACDGDTLAVTVAWSHKVFLVARREEDG